ncbi:MAG: response regulator [Planctomycetota bacterium]
MRFLIVDDDRSILALVEEMLANLGHETVSCQDAASACRVDEEIDGYVIDWHLGSETCESLTHHLREQHPHAPILMITGDADLNLIQSALSVGVLDWWFKPTGMPGLQTQLRGLIANANRPAADQSAA